jgi:ribonuclease HII
MNFFHNENVDYEIGVDESGRGTLFGPVFAAAVVFAKTTTVPSDVPLNDSKKLTPKRRAVVRKWVEENALAWSVAQRDHDYIDKHNIWKATLSAMSEAINNVKTQLKQSKSVSLVIDGNRFDNKEVGLPFVAIEKADAKYVHVAAASVLAKEHHDDTVRQLIAQHPELAVYNLTSSMGYATSKHCEAIREHGPSQWHRKTFGKVKEYVTHSEKQALECQPESQCQSVPPSRRFHLELDEGDLCNELVPSLKGTLHI